MFRTCSLMDVPPGSRVGKDNTAFLAQVFHERRNMGCLSGTFRAFERNKHGSSFLGGSHYTFIFGLISCHFQRLEFIISINNASLKYCLKDVVAGLVFHSSWNAEFGEISVYQSCSKKSPVYIVPVGYLRLSPV